MKRHDLIQGTPEWHEFRATHFGGSDAPAMMGVSPYKTRTELLKEKAVGISREVEPAAQRRFDDGHRYEAMARPLAAARIGEEIYPVVGSDGVLGASFDGMTMLGDVIWEHKSMNDEIRACFTMEDLPLVYRVQCEHNINVSGAERCLFSATKWDADGKLLEERHIWITPDLTLRAKIIGGWNLFAEELANFRLEDHAPAAEQPVGKAPETLPALHIEVTGMVTASNLDAFSEHAIAVFQGIKTDLATDEDFASAEKTVKWCKDVEDRLDAAKEHALGQTQSIDALFRAIDSIKAEARQKRLALDKLVKERKEQIRLEIVQGGNKLLADHLAKLNERIGGTWMPRIDARFADAIKGLKSLASIKDSVATALANAKIEANEVADRIEMNRKALVTDDADLIHLFPDFGSVCTNMPEVFTALVEQRNSKHQERVEAEAKAKVESAAVISQAKASATVTPVTQPPAAQASAPATPEQAVIDAEPRISNFLNSREWKKGKANEYRAVLVEFFKFEAGFIHKEAA